MTVDRLWGGGDPERQRECCNSEAVNIWRCLQRLLHQICSWTQMTWMLSSPRKRLEEAGPILCGHMACRVSTPLCFSPGFFRWFLYGQCDWWPCVCVCVSVCDDDVFFFFKWPRLLMASHRTVVCSNVHQLHDCLWLKINYSHLIRVPTTPLDNSPL